MQYKHFSHAIYWKSHDIDSQSNKIYAFCLIVNLLQSRKQVKSGIIAGKGKKMPIKLLVIDDDIAVTDLLTLLLKSHGYDVMAVNSGEEGVIVLREKKPDLIVLDLMMPDMDGWSVCKAVRAFSTVPIIILSALNDPAMIASILDAGADDYLTKPTPSSVLVAHVNKLVRRTTTGTLTSVSPPTRPVLSGMHP
jgi:CheY-like chemotaxis protein